jgi:hypothetical protein
MKRFIDFLVKWHIDDILLAIFLLIIIFSVTVWIGWGNDNYNIEY